MGQAEGGKLRLRTALDRVDLVSRYLPNGVPLFQTPLIRGGKSESSEEGDSGEGRFAPVSVDGDPSAALRNRECRENALNPSGTHTKFDTLTDLFLPSPKNADGRRTLEAGSQYLSSMSQQAEMTLIRTSQLLREEQAASRPLAKNRDLWVRVIAEQTKSSSQLARIDTVLEMSARGQSLQELGYPPMVEETHRPLYGFIPGISQCTETQECENITMATARRAAGFQVVIEEDISRAKDEFASAVSDTAFLNRLMCYLSPLWPIRTPGCAGELTEASQASGMVETDYHGVGRGIWLQLLAIPSAIWGLEKELEKQKRCLEATGDNRKTANGQAQAVIDLFLQEIENGTAAAPTPTWPPPMSPFQEFWVTLDIERRQARRIALMKIPGQWGSWINKGFELKFEISVDPQSIRMRSSRVIEERPVTPPTTCCVCSSSLSEWNELSAPPIISINPESRKVERMSRLALSPSLSKEDNITFRELQSELLNAKRVAMERCLFTIFQMQSAWFQSKAPLERGSGILRVGKRISSNPEEPALAGIGVLGGSNVLLKQLPVFGICSGLPLKGTFFDNSAPFPDDVSQVSRNYKMSAVKPNMAATTEPEDRSPPWIYAADVRENPLYEVKSLIDDMFLQQHDIMRFPIHPEASFQRQLSENGPKRTEKQAVVMCDLLYPYPEIKVNSWTPNSTTITLNDAPLFFHAIEKNTNSKQTCGVRGWLGDVQLTIRHAPMNSAHPVEGGRAFEKFVCRKCSLRFTRQLELLEILIKNKLMVDFANRWHQGTENVNALWSTCQPLTDCEGDGDGQDWSGLEMPGSYLTDKLIRYACSQLACGGPAVL